MPDKEMDQYFIDIEKEVKLAYDIANKARKKGFDPEDIVPIPLAKNMAERVEGLISAVSPQILNKGIPKRISELEKEYGAQDWRVAFKIAEELALEKFCKFSSKKEAMEIGIRTGFAYITMGVVASPLEGFVELRERKTRDGKTYLAISFAGPIRSAGGTGASVSVLIADYIRKKMGYATYDPGEKEIKRFSTELYDYHERITNLQYLPTVEEIEFLAKHIPIQIDGEPSEKIDVSNYKDLDRVDTDRIRNGVCLVLGEGIAQKAPKLWKQLSKWGGDFELDHWNFMEEFLKLQKKFKAKSKAVETKEKITPDYTYIKDLVAGRPVLAHPLNIGGFRLRFGRSRTSGYSAASIHPATMNVLNGYIATGSQLKTERPGKGCTVTPCDSIEGPIVLLNNGDVVQPTNALEAKKISSEIKEILYLGDILFNYGDFFNRAHSLVPSGYCPEHWIQELEKQSVNLFGTIDLDKLSEISGVDKQIISELMNNPLLTKISALDSFKISKTINIPLHPDYTYFWSALNYNHLLTLIDFSKKINISQEDGKIIKAIFPLDINAKRSFELAGIPHKVINNEFILLEKDIATSFCSTFDLINKKPDELISILNSNKEKPILEIINLLSKIKIRDKGGIFVGARMGRPEKAKMRKLTGSPHVLFPVGQEGGKLRCFQSALEAGKITGEFSIYRCKTCNRETVFRVCEKCNKPTKRMRFCNVCGLIETEKCPKHDYTSDYMKKEININELFDIFKKKLSLKTYPDLIKGVRGTSNKDHIPEHLVKGILRAKNDVYVNKDGTIRYDMTQLPITHFKPSEIGTSIEKLKQLGYTTDIKGNELQDPNQTIELKPQDIILPACDESPDEGADKVLFRATKFIDELLTKFYNLKEFYGLISEKDLAGHLVVILAPHTSAGIAGRIIGFSKTQGFLANPMIHAATRRDCFCYDTYMPFFINDTWQIKKIGEVVESLNPRNIVDDYGTREIKVKNFKTVGSSNGIVPVNINKFTKHSPFHIVLIKTSLGRKIRLTHNHKQIIFNNKKERVVFATELKKGDTLAIPYNIKIPQKDIKKFNLLELLSNEDWVMVRGINDLYNIKFHAKKYFSKRDYDNYTRRDSYPLRFITYLIKEKVIRDNNGLFVAAKRDNIKIPSIIDLSNDLLKLIGLYISEGYSRKAVGKKGLYQVYIASDNQEIRKFIQKTMSDSFNLKKSENKSDRITYSSRILYHFFINILKCGSSAYEKRMPFLNLTSKRAGYLLSGYFEGDGSVSKTDLRATFDTVSEGLLRDIDFIFGQMGIFVKNYTYTKKPGNKVRQFYEKNGKKVPKFTITKGIIQSIFIHKFAKYVGFLSKRKKEILAWLLEKRKPRKISQKFNKHFIFDTIKSVEFLEPEESYCLNVKNNKVIANSILSKQCDGDEASIMLLLDSLINFSRRFLPASRGSTQDAPLVLTSKLTPSEVDDMVFDFDVAWKYPLEFYNACQEYKKPWDVKIEQLAHRLDTELQYKDFGYTHKTTNINDGVTCSAYKIMPSMEEKLLGQMDLADKIRAADEVDVARLVIERHFLPDIKGNLRKFSMQQFRCVNCNEKYRRPPLSGKCKCGGKIIFTISEGSIIKYLEPAISLAKKYNLPSYLKQTLELTKRRVEDVFGKEKEKQIGLGQWFG